MKVTEQQFQSLFNERLGKIKDTLAIKAREYVRNNDRLHNFNVGANVTGQSREEILHGFLLKHLISYFDMINDIKKGNYPSDSYLQEKIGDIINYFILFEISVRAKTQIDHYEIGVDPLTELFALNNKKIPVNPEVFDFLKPNGTTHEINDSHATIGTL